MKFRSKKEIIYDTLRDAIIRGEYEANTRLVIDELAKTMGVSQIPIREAIQQLEADGFVRIEPNVGASIMELDATFIYEVFALLESMELISSTTACSVISDAEMDALTEMVTNMDAVVDDVEAWSEQNKSFHLFICECANTKLVLKMLKKTFAHWDRLRNHYLQDMRPNRTEEAQAQHHRMLEAFRDRDPQQVERIIRGHNQTALKNYIQHLEEKGLLMTESSIS